MVSKWIAMFYYHIATILSAIVNLDFFQLTLQTHIPLNEFSDASQSNVGSLIPYRGVPRLLKVSRSYHFLDLSKDLYQ